jgi:hypothetical protein
MKLSGVLPLRNGVSLGYPFDLAIRSLQRLCDEVVVSVDPTGDDGTAECVAALGVDRVIESRWDMSNYHDFGERPGVRHEIARQTEIVVDAARGDWIFSLQADEMIHECEIPTIRAAIEEAERGGVTGLETKRLYFYGSLASYRAGWTLPLVRLFRAYAWVPDFDAMQFVPVGPQPKRAIEPKIYHYSRIGDPLLVARRIRNLDHFYHAPETILDDSEVAPYRFDTLRRADTYVRGVAAGIDPDATLVPFPLAGHPAEALERFGE